MKATGSLRRWLGCLAAAAVVATGAHEAGAAGLLIADGGFGGVLEIVEHDVNVTINNGVAVTRVTQVFRNTEQRQVEALYTFPVPKGASVANFSMWINGKEMTGEVLEKKRAREIYNSYKQQRRDPGLLEQTDYRTFEMRIFPIAAGAEQRVQIAYYQELDYDHDWGTYVYPLATVTKPGIDSRVKGKFALNLEVKSEIPVVEVESPSHGENFMIVKHSPNYVQASLEAREGTVAEDIVLAYHTERPRTGIDTITSKPAGEDGYFCMTITAGEDLAKLDAGMDYVFVMDISGSMGDDQKLAISRKSVEAFVEALGDDDQFEVITFNVQPNTVFGKLQPATAENLKTASTYLRSQQARGGTVLNPAMTTAYKYGNPDRPLNVVILSDGLTEQGERTTLLRLIQERPRNARVFCIGVGNGVNRPLLEQMAEDSGGLAAFISQGDNFERQAQAFRRKLTRPVASGLVLKFDGGNVYDVEPVVLPNLYHGTPVRIYGRYRSPGNVKATLDADIRGMAFSKSAEINLPADEGGNPEIERMWAWKRMDRLLKDADRGGARDTVIDEIVRLGEAYSIVSEYTSFLVLENDGEYQRWKIDRRNALRIERDRRAQDRLRAEFDEIRNKAVADLGPQEPAKPAPQQAAPVQVARAPTPMPMNSAPRPMNRSIDFNFGGGSGPVGPMCLGLIAWLARRKRHLAR